MQRRDFQDSLPQKWMIFAGKNKQQQHFFRDRPWETNYGVQKWWFSPAKRFFRRLALGNSLNDEFRKVIFAANLFPLKISLFRSNQANESQLLKQKSRIIFTKSIAHLVSNHCKMVSTFSRTENPRVIQDGSARRVFFLAPKVFFLAGKKVPFEKKVPLW